MLRMKNANLVSIIQALKGHRDRISSNRLGRNLVYEDNNVMIDFLFSPSGDLTEAKCIWYANKYQCLKFTDLTMEGVNKYFKMFAICA